MITDNSLIINNFNHEHINFFSRRTADVLFKRLGFINEQHHISLSVNIYNIVQFSNVALYRRTDENTETELIKDFNLKESILEYTERMSHKETELLQRIEKLFRSNIKIAVWGSGAYLFHLMKVYKLPQCNIAYIVDANKSKQGKSVF